MSESVKSFVSWLGIIGIPSIFTMTIWCIQACKSYTKSLKILQQAQKAQMRSQLLHQYYCYMEQDVVAADDVDDWINQYNAYHELVGPNGVLDARKVELLKKPTYERK